MEKGGQDAGGLPQHSPSGRSEDRASGPSQSAEPKTTEDLIRTCSDDPGPAPFHVACFNGRPLQVIPPGSSGAHIMLFTDLNLAEAFTSERARIYPDESAGLSPVAAISDVLRLTRAKSTDPNYIGPPCGLVLDFSYTGRSGALTLAPAEMSKMNAAKLARIVSRRAAEPWIGHLKKPPP